jgi:hypothetical protein
MRVNCMSSRATIWLHSGQVRPRIGAFRGSSSPKTLISQPGQQLSTAGSTSRAWKNLFQAFAREARLR